MLRPHAPFGLHDSPSTGKRFPAWGGAVMRSDGVRIANIRTECRKGREELGPRESAQLFGRDPAYVWRRGYERTRMRSVVSCLACAIALGVSSHGQGQSDSPPTAAPAAPLETPAPHACVPDCRSGF